jgi:hypothetical protein
MYVTSTIRVTCSSRLIFLYLTLTIFNENCKLGSPLMCTFLGSTFTTFVAAAKYLSQHLVFKLLQLAFFPKCKRLSFTHIKIWQDYNSLHFSRIECWEGCLGLKSDEVTRVAKAAKRRVLCSLSLTKYYWGHQIKKPEIGRAWSTYVGEEKCIQGFGGETWGKETN